MKRRTVLKLGVATLGAGTLGYGVLMLAGASRSCAGTGLPGFETRAALAHVGENYLRNVASSQERTELAAVLRRIIRDTKGDLAVALWVGATRLAGSSKDDFSSGNTVICDGWVLARGEARSCALLALAATASPLSAFRG